MSIDHIADDLAIAATSVPTPNRTENWYGGYDLATPHGTVIRTAVDNGRGRLIALNAGGILLYDATFAAGTPRPVIVAAVHAAYHAAVAADRHAEIEQAAL